MQAIREKQFAALQCAEEKVCVADQAYDVVDKHIRMLGAGRFSVGLQHPLCRCCDAGHV